MPKSSRRSRSVVTITDVARAAGVSAMTVSRVMNDGNNVKDSTRDAVRAAIRSLNYAPNLAARNLAKAEDVRIGVIYSNPSANFLSEFLIGVLDEAAADSAQLVLVKCGEGAGEELAAVRRLVDAGVRGVVLPPPVSESAVVRGALKAADIAVAVVAAGLPPDDASCVRVDDRQGAYEMTRHLLELGHRRIGLIVGHPNQTSSSERRAGFDKAMGEVEGASVLIAQGFFDYASGLAAAEALLDDDRPPTAIFASNDDMAAAVVSVAHRRGLDVPRDLSVVGFDDTGVATTLWPPLTTIRQPVRSMAASAIGLLMAALRGRRDEPPPAAVDTVLPYTLVRRQSSAPPSARRRRRDV